MPRKIDLRILIASVAVVGLAASAARADVKVPGVFGDQMVLQRQMKVPVWGWAEPGEKVTVKLGDRSQQATADDEGNWSVALEPLEAGGPHVLTVQGKNKLEFKDVLVGEVWLCSGQSNMAMTVNRSLNAKEEIAAADFPQIRMLTVARNSSPEPVGDIKGTWRPASPETVGGFSATAFFFGRKLHEELDVPVGLINSSWGGTAIEAWTSMPAQREVAKLEGLLKEWQARVDAAKKPQQATALRRNQNHPANLYNGMISPLVGYAIRGAIWYQGERNSKSDEAGRLYRAQLPLLVRDWREAWGQGEFPFLWVQLPNFRKRQTEPVETSGWVLVRDAMLRGLEVPNTGMAVTTDVGEANDIHPKNKQAVGKRLALWALGRVYDKDIVYSGPIYGSMKKTNGSISIRFDHSDSPLTAQGGGPLEGFAIAGKDGEWVWAEAQITGDDTVEVSSPKVKDPVAVRYNWAANPIGNLYNEAGLPASPFTSEEQP